MGKRRVHVIVVRKPVSFALLLLVTAALVALLYFLSGKAYAAETNPVRDALARLLGSRRVALSRDALLAMLMPVLGNILLFLPWGFLAFVVFDREPRRPLRTYVMTLVAAIVFSAALYLWQSFLPTRVTSVTDAAANAAGALAGAFMAHARRRLLVRFDF
ncbi:MAG TPA: VanZ family protein [Thermoanaerobaculia bacterium]|jgi:VanZ family protein